MFTSENAKLVETIRVVDPHPLNWLYITYNAVGELLWVDRWETHHPCRRRKGL